MTKGELEDLVFKQHRGFEFVLRYTKESKRQNVTGYFLLNNLQPNELSDKNNWFFITTENANQYQLYNNLIDSIEKKLPKSENDAAEIEKIKEERKLLFTTVYGDDVEGVERIRINSLFKN